MTKTARYLAVLISLPVLNIPSFAQTSFEQLSGLSPDIEFAGSMAVSGGIGYAGAEVAGALVKLSLFDYQRSDVLSVERHRPLSLAGYTVETIALRINDPLRQKGEFDQGYTYYKSKRPEPRPVVLIPMHFMGSHTLSDWAAAYFARSGYHAVVINPAESLTDTSRPIDKIDDLLIREAITGRMIIDLLETLPEIDKEKIYGFGISMGAIRTALLFGVEPRMKKAGEVSGGGDLPGIIADTHFPSLKSVRDARMKAEGLATVEDFRTYMTSVMTMDPLDFGIMRRPEDFLMVISRGDMFVSDAYQEKLYDAFSKPQEGRFPAVIRSGNGHAVTAFQYQRYVDSCIEFFEK